MSTEFVYVLLDLLRVHIWMEDIYIEASSMGGAEVLNLFTPIATQLKPTVRTPITNSCRHFCFILYTTAQLYRYCLLLYVL